MHDANAIKQDLHFETNNVSMHLFNRHKMVEKINAVCKQFNSCFELFSQEVLLHESFGLCNFTSQYIIIIILSEMFTSTRLYQEAQSTHMHDLDDS